MFKLKQQPYNLLLIVSIVLVVSTFFHFNSKIDYHLHDTYYIFPIKILIWIIVSFFSLLWLLYRLIEKIIYSKTLVWVHIIVTILCFILIALLSFITDNYQPSTYSYTDFDDFIFTGPYKVISFISIVLIVFQFVFIINLLLSIYELVKQR